METFQDAAKSAGLIVEYITLSQIGVVNAARALPSDSHAEVAALLDIGSNHSSIGILMNGELALTRTVTVGAGKLADFFGKTGTADLKAGKCYISAVSRNNPRLSARADIVFSA